MPFFKYQNLIEIFQHDRDRYLPIIQFIETVMQGESAFTAGERELIAAYVSGLNACDFCAGAHQALAEHLKVEPNLLTAMLADLTQAPVEDRLRPVFSFVSKLTLNPSQIIQADIDAVLKAGWDSQAIEDAIDICALFNFMNRFVDGYGLKLPDREQLAALVRGINNQGYENFFLSSN